MSEDDFFRVMFPQAATPGVPRVLPLLELMFGPGARREGRHVFRVGKRSTVAKILPDEATFWPTSATKPFAVLHVGPIQKSALTDAYSRKLNGDVEREVVSGMVEEVLEGFGKSKGLDWQSEHGNPRSTVVVLTVQDGDAHVSYFGTRLDKGYLSVNFALREPAADDAAAREYLREFYEERVLLLLGTRWQTAFFLPDLRRRLSRDLPADWKLSQEAVTLELLVPGVSITFNYDHLLSFKFWDNAVANWYTVPALDSMDAVGRVVGQLIDLMLPNRNGAIKWCVAHGTTSVDKQKLVDVISELPPWLTAIFEAQLQKAGEAGEDHVAHLQKTLLAESERLDFIRQTKDLLAARR